MGVIGNITPMLLCLQTRPQWSTFKIRDQLLPLATMNSFGQGSMISSSNDKEEEEEEEAAEDDKVVVADVAAIPMVSAKVVLPWSKRSPILVPNELLTCRHTDHRARETILNKSR